MYQPGKLVISSKPSLNGKHGAGVGVAVGVAVGPGDGVGVAEGVAVGVGVGGGVAVGPGVDVGLGVGVGVGAPSTQVTATGFSRASGPLVCRAYVTCEGELALPVSANVILAQPSGPIATSKKSSNTRVPELQSRPRLQIGPKCVM